MKLKNKQNCWVIKILQSAKIKKTNKFNYKYYFLGDHVGTNKGFFSPLDK
jgi:hypothetical protein